MKIKLGGHVHKAAFFPPVQNTSSDIYHSSLYKNFLTSALRGKFDTKEILYCLNENIISKNPFVWR